MRIVSRHMILYVELKSTYKMCANIKGYGTSVCFLALFLNFFIYSNDEDVKY